MGVKWRQKPAKLPYVSAMAAGIGGQACPCHSESLMVSKSKALGPSPPSLRPSALQGCDAPVSPHLDHSCSFSKALCPWVQAEPHWAGRRTLLVPDYSILSSSFQLWHRARPQLVSSLIPQADSPQEALRHLEAELANPRAEGTPCGPSQAQCDLPPPVVLGLHLCYPESRPGRRVSV